MRFAIAILWLVLAACAQDPDPAGPRAGTGARADAADQDNSVPDGPPQDTRAHEGMVAAAHPLAVEAGLDILRAGGGAADAAAAVQAVLSLVEPQSSGLGGGGFLVYFDAATGTVTSYDGRETAPAAADAELFFDEDGAALPFLTAWTSGRAAGVPGIVAMLGLVHEDHGRLDWADLFGGAVILAEEGFAVSPRLSESIARTAQFGALAERAETRAYFFTPEGAPLPAGHVLRNPDYAATLRILAERGPGAFYEGEIVEAIIAAARAAPYSSALTAADFAAYRPKRGEALCNPYRVWLVCSAPPPSSGGVMTGQALALLEPFALDRAGPETAEGWHRLIEALRLSYADRDLYVADPDFADVPTQGLLDRDYLAGRAALIAPDRAIERAEAGVPPGAPARGGDATHETPGTTHFVIVDRWGDVASATTTVEAAFGSQIMAGGFLLNNQLTDFALDPYGPDGAELANAPAGGKRPRSSMSPTIVLERDSGAFTLAVGSPGGNAIPSYVVKALAGMLDWGLPAQEAVDLPNIVARGDTVQVETGFAEPALEGLRALGHRIGEPRGENSGLHAVRVLPDGSLEGGADSRREGQARAP